ncbi:hypothetical protein FOZ63_026023, partial [Perkinsus olseni]
MSRDQIHVSAEYTALEGKIEHVERVSRIELEQHTRKCRAELTERIDDVVSYIARNLSSDSRHSSARLKDISTDMAAVKADLKKSAGLKEAVENLTEKMQAMQSDIDSMARRGGGGSSRSRSGGQGKMPTLESVEGHKDLKIVIDECLNLTKRVKALERGRYGGTGGGGHSSRASHHAVPEEPESEVRALGEEVRQCLAATVDLRRYIDSAITRVDNRLTAFERSALRPTTPVGMDTPSTLPATIPEGRVEGKGESTRLSVCPKERRCADLSWGECIEHLPISDSPPLPLSTDVVCSYQLAVGLPVSELVVVERAVDDAGSRGPGTRRGPQSTGTASRQVDSNLRGLGEGLERNQEQLVILRENLAETRRVVSESVAADSPQLVSRVTALCEDRVSALADSLLQRPEVSDRFHRIEAKGCIKGPSDIASRYEPLTRSLDMLKEVVRQRDDRQAEFDRQLREQKAHLNTATRALGEFKEEMATLRSARSREGDEFKADITDLRLSLGALERKCEMKIEQRLEGVQRKGRELDKIAASQKWMEEGVQGNKASMDAMLRQKADEFERREEKLLADCRAASKGLEMSTNELVQKSRAEILAEVHLEIMEAERRLSTCAAGKTEEIAGVEERLGKLEGEMKKRSSGHPSSGRVVTITASTPSLGDDPSSSEDSYDEMQRDIKYDHICSRLDKLEKIAPRVSQAEAAVQKLTQDQSELSDAVSSKIASANSTLREEVEKLGEDAGEGINSVKEGLAGVSEQLGGVLTEQSKFAGGREELRRVAEEVRRLKERGVGREEFEKCMTDVDVGRARIEDRVREMSSTLQAIESKLEAVSARVDEGGLVEAVEELRVSTKEWPRRTEEVEERVTNLAGNLGEGIRALESRADSIERVEQRAGGAIERVEGEVAVLRRSVAEVSGLQSSVEE